MGTIDFSALVRQHLKPLVLFARQWDDAAAEDLAHDAFVRLAELVRDGQPPDNVSAWLYRVTRNAAIDRLRHKRQQSKHAEHYAAEWFVTRESGNEQHGERLDNRLDGRMLTEWLRELPLEQREVIVAHLWGGLTFREIAELVGRSFSTVRREFHQGLETIREKLV